MPVIHASDKTHLTNYSGELQAWQLYLTIGNDQKNNRHTPERFSGFLFGPIPCPPNGAKNTDEAWHYYGDI